MANALLRGRRQRLASEKSCEPVRRKGLGVNVHVTTGAKPAGLALIVKAAGAAALVVAFTDTIFAQSGSDFLNNVDPLFSGVLTHPGNLDNTIQYAASAAAHGDIESAISTYEQLRFYNPKLCATRYQLGVLYYLLGSHAQARGYLQTAAEPGGAPADHRDQQRHPSMTSRAA
jgi:hypothetical protein